jgi:hypothetical protein
MTEDFDHYFSQVRDPHERIAAMAVFDAATLAKKWFEAQRITATAGDIVALAALLRSEAARPMDPFEAAFQNYGDEPSGHQRQESAMELLMRKRKEKRNNER